MAARPPAASAGRMHGTRTLGDEAVDEHGRHVAEAVDVLDRPRPGDGVGKGVDASVEEVLDGAAQVVGLAGGVDDERQAAAPAGGIVEAGDRLAACRVHGDLVGDQPDRARPLVAQRSSVQVGR